MSYTYALLGVSRAAYDEIASRLRHAEYDHCFGEDGEIDMHGIALTPIDKCAGVTCALDCCRNRDALDVSTAFSPSDHHGC